MLHTAGFPAAPLAPLAGATSAGRRAAFGQLAAQLGAGHALRVPPDVGALGARRDHRAGHGRRLPRRRRASASPSPLGLPPRPRPAADWRAAPLVVARWRWPTPDELQAAFGMRELPVTEVTTEALLAFNDPAVRAVGVPGGGGVMRASDLAPFYQALLHNPGWDVEARRARRRRSVNVRNSLPDPLTGNAGEPHARAGAWRATTGSPPAGHGRTVSPRAFGHNGAVARSPGPTPRPACPSATAPTASTSTPSASPAAARPCRASPGRASPSEPCRTCASSQTTSGWPSAGNASTAWRWGRA